MAQIIDVRTRLPDEFRTITPNEKAEFYGMYDEVLDVYDSSTQNTEDLLNEMELAGVTHAIVHAEYEFGEDADDLNKKVANLIKMYPNKLSGFGTVNLANLDSLKLLEQGKFIKDSNLKGINLQPVFFDVDPLDRRLYPLYAYAAENNLIISFHTGIHYSLKTSIINNNPIFIDTIATDFPGLKIIACHGGWPWVGEMVAVARRHQNIFIEFGGMDPKYIAKENSGWDILFNQMDNLLSRQVLFGTDWPVIPLNKALNSWKNTTLKEKTLERLFHTNAQKLLFKGNE